MTCEDVQAGDVNTQAPWRDNPSHYTGRIDAVGTLGRANTVLFAVPRSSAASLHIVAFPGDAVACSSWHALSGAHGDHAHSGGLLAVLRDRFHREGGIYQHSAIFVVEPARIARTRHSLFEHFLLLPLTATGEAAEGYSARGGAAAHLAALLECTYAHIAGAHTLQLSGATASVILCGFSKGAVVCNQLHYECASVAMNAREGSAPSARPPRGAAVTAAADEVQTPTQRVDMSSADGRVLLNRIVEVHYLDAGLLSRGAFMTDPAIAEALASLEQRPRVCLHGTPRQWRDPSRRWLPDEKDRCVAVLTAAGVHVAQREYLPDAPLTLDTHFACVTHFDPCLLGRLDAGMVMEPAVGVVVGSGAER